MPARPEPGGRRAWIVQGPARFAGISMTNPPSPQASPALSMSATDWAARCCVLSVLWGGSFYFAKIAVLEIPPLTLRSAASASRPQRLSSSPALLAVPFPRDPAVWRSLPS